VSTVPPEPGPLPPPPDDLPARPLPLRAVTARWYRVHGSRHGAVFFGRAGSNRFDAPAGQYGVLYLGADPACSFIETLGRTAGRRPMSLRELSLHRMALVHPPRPLRLVDVTGAGLARIGADARLFAGDHAVARRWSLALFGHPGAPDGILYPARHDPSLRAAAVFDRVKGRWRVKDLGRLDDPGNRALVGEILDRYGFGLLA
jgi:hypothetical protein